MKTLLDIAFATAGTRRLRQEPGPDCPSDELLAGYADSLLTATEIRRLEDHALECPDCHLVLKTVLDLRSAPATAPRRVSVVARVLQRGLELLNPLEVTLRSLVDGPAPALGAVRGEGAGASTEVIAVEGPGHGLDQVEIRLQPDGQVRLEVRGDEPPPVYAGEIASVVLEVDGAPREKRPFSGAPLAFAPQDHGSYRIRLVARAPGADPRELGEAVIELRD